MRDRTKYGRLKNVKSCRCICKSVGYGGVDSSLGSVRLGRGPSPSAEEYEGRDLARTTVRV